MLVSFMFCMVTVGCLSIQVKDDVEILSAPSFIVESLADYIVIKYSSEVENLIELSDKVINADSNDLVEIYFNDWINSLTRNIEDPFVQRRAKAILNSFEINVDTGNADLDMGSIRVVKNLVQLFKDQLEV